MKGILKKDKEGKWIVEFLQKLTNADTWVKELPLHPDSVFKLKLVGQLHGGGHILENTEVEFEIVAYGNPCKYHKNLLDCKNPPNCDCEFNYVAKLITSKQEKTNTSWDEIMQEWSDLQTQIPFIDYLKKLYHPPIKIIKLNI